MLVQVKPQTVDSEGILAVSTCFSCGNKRATESVGGMDAGLLACGDCILKHGRENLTAEADRILAWLLSPEGRRDAAPTVTDAKCGHCGKPVEQDPFTKEVPLVCTKCWDEAIRRFNQ